MQRVCGRLRPQGTEEPLADERRLVDPRNHVEQEAPSDHAGTGQEGNKGVAW